MLHQLHHSRVFSIRLIPQVCGPLGILAGIIIILAGTLSAFFAAETHGNERAAERNAAAIFACYR